MCTANCSWCLSIAYLCVIFSVYSHSLSLVFLVHVFNGTFGSPPPVFPRELTQDSRGVLRKRAGSGGCLVVSVALPLTKRIDSNLRLTGLFVSC